MKDITHLPSESIDFRYMLQAYKYSAVLINAFQLDLFERIGHELPWNQLSSTFNPHEIDIIEILRSFSILVVCDGKLNISSEYKDSLLRCGTRYIGDFAKWQGYHYHRYGSFVSSELTSFNQMTWLKALDQLACFSERDDWLATIISKLDIKKLVDIGGGSGVYSKAILKADHEVSSMIFEREVMIDTVKSFFNHDYSSRLKITSSLSEVAEFSPDAALLSNFLHGRDERFIQDLLNGLSEYVDYIIVHGSHRSTGTDYSVEGTLLNLTMKRNGGIGNYTIEDIVKFTCAHGYKLVAQHTFSDPVPEVLIFGRD